MRNKSLTEEPSGWYLEKVPSDVHEYPIELKHYVKYKNLTSFPYAKFSIPLKVLFPSAFEYRTFLQSRDWMPKSTEELLRVCEFHEGNFVIAADRLCAELIGVKTRFFETQEKLLVARKLALDFVAMAAKHLSKGGSLKNENEIAEAVAVRKEELTETAAQFAGSALSKVAVDPKITAALFYQKGVPILAEKKLSSKKDTLALANVEALLNVESKDFLQFFVQYVSTFSLSFFDAEKESTRRAALARAFARSRKDEQSLAETLVRFEKVTEEIERIQSSHEKALKRAQSALEKFKTGVVHDGLLDTVSLLDICVEPLSDAALREHFLENCVLVKEADKRLIDAKRMIAPTDIFPLVAALKKTDKNKVFLRSEILLKPIEVRLLGTKLVFPLQTEAFERHKSLIDLIRNNQLAKTQLVSLSKEELGIYLSIQFDQHMSNTLGSDKFYINTETVQSFYEKFCLDLGILVGLEYLNAIN